MIEVNRAVLGAAIRAGATDAGEWRICRLEGQVFWHQYVSFRMPSPHDAHASIRIPALYLHGRYSEYRAFLSWARGLAPERRFEVLSLAQGTISAVNSEGTAYAVPCIVGYFLTPEEQKSWYASVAATVNTYAEGCLQELNSIHGRPRYRFSYAETSIGSAIA